MALLIADGRVRCGTCVPACPDRAIREGEFYYVIDGAWCTECVGSFAEPHCVPACPVGCIVAHPVRHDLKRGVPQEF